MGSEDNEYLPFFFQIVKRAIEGRKIFFVKSFGKLLTLRLEHHKYRIIDDLEFTSICKDRLKLFLNPYVYKQLKDSGDESIVIEGIRIDVNTLQKAYKGDFHLKREATALMEELRETYELHKNETDITPSKDCLPCGNGIVRIQSGKFEQYADNSIGYCTLN
jgi:hypothetical protein